jgi:hypothetical protein
VAQQLPMMVPAPAVVYQAAPVVYAPYPVYPAYPYPYYRPAFPVGISLGFNFSRHGGRRWR